MKSPLSVIVFYLMAVGAYCQTPSGCGGRVPFQEMHLTNRFVHPPDTVGVIKQKEISGIVPSIKYPHHFWAINDSGNGAVLYLYSSKNATVKAVFILQGMSNVDWEDITIKKTGIGQGILFIGDIGDNRAKRKIHTIYALSEPDIEDHEAMVHKLQVDPVRITYTYENGARDAESLAYDPLSQVIYIFSKREENIFIYALDTQNADTVHVLAPIGNLPYNNIVGADFSSDGMRLLLKSYTHVLLWTRTSEAMSFCTMISATPERVPYQLEPQGESICFTEDGGFMTLSEERFGIPPMLYTYPLSEK